jgi:hypothetical protein
MVEYIDPDFFFSIEPWPIIWCFKTIGLEIVMN